MYGEMSQAEKRHTKTYHKARDCSHESEAWNYLVAQTANKFIWDIDK
jgi:hypothetical protein